MTIPPEVLLAGYPEAMIDLAEELRLIVRRALPEAIEAVRTGWRLIGYDLPIGRRTAFFAWIMPERHHVHLGFPKGVLLADPAQRLGGAGETKRARWLTLEAGEAIPVEIFEAYVREAARVAGLSSSEQGAILLDLEARSGGSSWSS
ncbi:MAG TPA: DUF1801 domain-containing protein [Candidatus Limnocylindrales bacterium]|jgi:hypothetical protein